MPIGFMPPLDYAILSLTDAILMRDESVAFICQDLFPLPF